MLNSRDAALGDDEEQSVSSESPSALSEINALSDAEVRSRAKRIMGPHKDLASFSEARFEQHLAAAESYMKQGIYYRACDSYTLASIYRANDPQVFAGKGHALFAAGEYVSSSLFISRALEASPEYARSKVDLAGLMGPDRIESRIADVKEWLEKSKSGELEFLLAYIYHRMGRVREAKGFIDAATAKMPGSSAAATLKKAIEEATSSNTK